MERKPPPTGPIRRCVWVVVTLALTAPARGLTLEESFTRAIEVSPQIVSARRALEASREGIAVARGLSWRPQVSASVGYNRGELRAVERDRAAAGQIDSLATERYAGTSVGLTSTLYLYRGGRTEAEIGIAGTSAEQAAIRVLAAEQAVLDAVLGAYVQAEAAERRLALLRDETAALRRIEAAYADMLRRGLISSADYHSVVAQRRSAEAELAQAESDRLSGIEQLTALLRTPVGSRLTAPDLSRHIRGGLPELERQLLEKNPDIAIARREVEAQRHQVALAIGQVLPTVSLSAGISYQLTQEREGGTATSPYGPYTADSRDTNWNVGVNLSIPLYAGGANIARISQARRNLQSAEAALSAQILSSRNPLAAAWEARQAALKRLQMERARAGDLRTVVDGLERGVRDGTRTVQDMLRARLDLLASRSSQLQLRASAVQTEGRILALTGRLNAAGLGLAPAAGR